MWKNTEMISTQKTEKFAVEVDQFSANDWDATLAGFSDGNIYQSLAYGSVCWGSRRLSHMVVSKGENIAGAAQVVIMRIPLTNIGIAYIPWGPLWRPAGTENNLENLQIILHALEQEYCGRRGLCLRIRPNIISDEFDSISGLLQNLRFLSVSRKKAYRTFLVDLSRSQDELRRGLKKKWRASLRKAEKNDRLTIYYGKDESLFDDFLRLYKEMQHFKHFSGASPYNFREVQKKLSYEQKMITFIVKKSSRPLSGLICSIIGDVALGLFAATNEEGRRLNASHLAEWNELKCLREMGVPWMDAGGIDPESFPGGYKFKAGYAQKNGYDVTHIGVFESTRSPVLNSIVRVFESTRTQYEKLKTKSPLFNK
jgi:lipid II:glycine glycyltransferase (peptidoglycan interpeptide bridge formation enzyme)